MKNTIKKILRGTLTAFYSICWAVALVPLFAIMSTFFAMFLWCYADEARTYITILQEVVGDWFEPSLPTKIWKV